MKAESTTSLRLSEPLERDHHRLARILEDVGYLADHRSFVQAAKRFGELRRGLELHFGSEEDVLFPFLLSRQGDAALVERARSEHARLRPLLEQTSAALSCWDGEALRRLLPMLASGLRQHHLTEEADLYRDLRQRTSAAEWHSLLLQCHLE